MSFYLLISIEQSEYSSYAERTLNVKHDRLTLISALADYEISLTSSSTTEGNPTRLHI
jgi:hypothetical protein